MCISINFSIQKWQIKKDSTPAQAAIVYPFKRGNLKSVDGDSSTSKKSNETENEEDATQQRVIKYFIKDRSLDTSELESTESAAKLLIETHPVDQNSFIDQTFWPQDSNLKFIGFVLATFSRNLLFRAP